MFLKLSGKICDSDDFIYCQFKKHDVFKFEGFVIQMTSSITDLRYIMFSNILERFVIQTTSFVVDLRYITFSNSLE